MTRCPKWLRELTPAADQRLAEVLRRALGRRDGYIAGLAFAPSSAKVN